MNLIISQTSPFSSQSLSEKNPNSDEKESSTNTVQAGYIRREKVIKRKRKIDQQRYSGPLLLLMSNFPQNTMRISFWFATNKAFIKNAKIVQET